MSKKVDERVVEMRFDNAQFESGVATSMSTLERLKRSLNLKGASKGFDDVSSAAKKVNLSGIDKAVDSLKVKFSALDVMAVTALANITNSAVNAGKKMVSALAEPLVEGGKQRAQNIEQAKFQLEGLGVAWDDIKDDINYGVKDTAYGLDAAAKVAAQLTASGIKTGEAMQTSLRGISGLASMTGSSYEDIGRIFTTVAGNGRMFATELNEIGSRGVNAAATLGKYLGKTEGEVRDMVSEGEIDFATFAAAMDSAFGEHAKDANKLFSGAMSNMRAALSRIGADFATPAYDNLKNVFNALIPVIDTVHEKLGPLITDVSKVMETVGNFAVSKINGLDFSWMTPAIEGVENVFKNLWTVFQPIKEAFSEIFSPITAEQIFGVAEKFRDFTANFKMSEDTANKLKSAFKGVFSLFDIGIQGISALAKGFGELIGFSAPLGGGILDIAASIGDFITKIDESIKSVGLFDTIIGGITKFLGGIGKTIGSIGKDISTAFKAFWGIGSGDDVTKPFFDIAKKIGEAIGKIGEWISKGIKNLNFNKILGLLNTGLFGGFVVMIKKFIDKLSKIGEQKSIFAPIKELLDGVKGSLEAWQSSLKADTLLKIAGALGILAAALIALSFINPQSLTVSLGAITIALGELIGALAIVQKIAGKGKLKGTSTLISMVLSLLIVASAIKKLASLKWEQLGRGLTGMVVTLGALVGAIALIQKIAGKGKLKGTTTLLSMALSLMMVGSVIKKLGALSWGQLGRGLTGMVVALGALVGAIALIQKIAGKGKLKGTTTLLSMALSLVMVGSVIKKLGSLSWEQLGRGLTGTVVALGALVGAIALIQKIAGKEKLKGTTTLLSMALSLMMVGSVIKKLGSLEWGELGRGLTGMVVALGALVGAIALIQKIAGKGKLKGTTTLLSMALSLVMVGSVIKKLGSLEWGELGRGLTGMVVALGALVGAIALIQKIAGNGKLKGTTTLLSMALSLVMVGSAIKELATLEWEQLGRGLTGMVVALGTLIGAIALIQKIAGKGRLKGTASLLGLSIAVAIIGNVIAQLAEMPVASSLGAAASLSTVLLSLSAACAILSKFGTVGPKELLSVAIMAAIMAALGAVLYALSGLPIESTIATAASLSVMLLSLSAACGILSLVGKAGEGGFIGIAVLAALIVAIGALIVGIGALMTQVPKLEEFLNKGIPILEQIGNAIGSFFGNIVKGFVENAATGIEQVGTSLSNFMTNLQPFMDGVKSFDSSVTEGVKNLAQTLLILAGVNIAETFASWLAGGSSVSNFATQLAPLGEALTSFGDSIADLTPETATKIKTAAEAAKALAEFAQSIPNEGGLVAKLTGDNSLTSFAEGLKDFGAALKDYAASTTDIDDTVVERIRKTAEVGKALTEFARNIPNEGGFVSKLTGDNSLTSFAEGLKDFGAALKDYAASTTDIDDTIVERIRKTAEVGKALTEFAKNIPNEGGGVAKLTGDNSLTSFAEGLKDFGAALKDYAASTTDIDDTVVERIRKTAEITKAFVELAQDIPNEGFSFASVFSGDNDLGTFSKGLTAFGEALADFSATTSSVNPESISAIISSLSIPADSLSFASIFTDNGNLGAFSKGLKQLGDALADFASVTASVTPESISAPIKALVDSLNSLSQLDTSGLDESAANLVSGFSEAIESNGSQVSDAGSNLGESLASGLSESEGSVEAAGSSVAASGASGASGQAGIYNPIGQLFGNNMASGLVGFGPAMNAAASSAAASGASGANGQAGAYSGAGTTLGSNLASGLQGFSGALSATGAATAGAGASGASSQSGTFNSTGGILGQALASGILGGSGAASSAGASLGQAGASGASGQAGAFSSAGSSMAAGLAAGIRSGASSVISAAVSLAQSALQAAKNALGIHSPSRAFIALGNYIGEGLAIGIRNSTRQALNESEEMAQRVAEIASKSIEDIEDWVSTEKHFDNLSPEEELELWEAVIERYAEGSEERLKAEKNAYTVYKQLADERMDLLENDLDLLDEEIAKQKELVASLNAGTEAYNKANKALEKLENLRSDAAWEHSKNWIEREKDYNRLSLDEEIAAWERMQARSVWGTEQREEADKKLYELRHERMEGDLDLIQEAIKNQNELIDTLEQGTFAYDEAIKERIYLEKMYKEAQLDNSESWISRRDTFGRERGLAEELAEAIRVQQRYVKGTEERLEWDEKVYNLEKEIYDKQEQYTKDCEDLEKDREEQRTELVEEYADKVKDINEQLEKDIQDLNDEYTDAFESRMKSLYDAYGLFDEVSQKDDVKASKLMRNLQDQVAYFEDWDDLMNQLSSRGLDSALIEELQEMGPSAYSEIKALNSMTDSQLAQYANLWADKHREAKDRATDELEDMRISTQSQISELRSAANDEIKAAQDDLWMALRDMNADIDSQLEELKTNFQTEVGIIKTDTVGKFLEMDAAVKGILSSAGYNEVGQQMVDGLTEGVESGRPRFVEEIIGLSGDALNALKTALGIHSPSRKFAELGGYIGSGLTLGIRNCYGKVSNTSKGMGTTAMDALRSTIGKITDVINGNIDCTPTIRPVLDMSGVAGGIEWMNGAFSANRSMSLGVRISHANQNENGPGIAELVNANAAANGKIADTIAGIKNDISDLVGKVTRLQVVMDTGRLVGEITPEMDRSLGSAAIMRRRGV